MQMTIGDYLISRLSELGVRNVLGVPGDFNLQFLDQIKHTPGVDFIGCRNELNAAYAADGYGRINGMSALLTTYGVGDLSALCGVAGAATEHVPMICISGAPPLHAMNSHQPVHHTMGDGDYSNVMTCFAQFCSVCTRLTPGNAVTEIDRALTASHQDKQPVYIQLPSDISHITIDVGDAPLRLAANTSTERLESALSGLLQLWRAASRPAILVDMDAQRMGCDKQLLAFAEATATPYAALLTGKAILPERHPLFMGTYNGAASSDTCRDYIENTDFLLTSSSRFIEANSGLFTARLPETGVVKLANNTVTIDNKVYYAVNPAELLKRFLEVLQQDAKAAPGSYDVDPATKATPIRKQAPLTQARLWPRIARFIAPDDVVLAESGTSNIGLGGQRLPANVTYISSTFWGAIGATLPMTLGTSLAAPERRQLLFIGDGSFQLTVQELSTLQECKRKPIIFLLNNRGYTIERFIYGREDTYNNVPDWNYRALPTVFGSTDDHITLYASNEAQLEKALAQAESSDKLVFIELVLDPLDAPESLKGFGAMTAEFDYGPLGPQRKTDATPKVEEPAEEPVHSI